MKNILMGMGIMGILLMAVSVAQDSLFVNSNGFVGIGTNNPDKAVHVLGAPGGPEALYKLEQAEAVKVRFALANPNGAWTFDMSADAKAFTISKVGKGEIFRVTEQGRMYLLGKQIH